MSFHIKHDGFDKMMDNLFALAGMKPRRVETRDDHEALMDAHDMAQEQARVGEEGTCAICFYRGPLIQGYCPDCFSDLKIDESMAHE